MGTEGEGGLQWGIRLERTPSAIRRSRDLIPKHNPFARRIIAVTRNNPSPPARYFILPESN